MHYGTISNSKIQVAPYPNGAGVRVFGGWDVVTRIHNTVVDAPTAIVNMYGGIIKCANVYDADLLRVCN